MSKIIDLTLQNAKEISEYLKANYAGKRIPKSKVMIKFGLPYSRGALVMHALENYGIKNQWHVLIIPARPQQ